MILSARSRQGSRLPRREGPPPWIPLALMVLSTLLGRIAHDASAQVGTTTGIIVGTVVDNTRAVMPGVAITASGPAMMGVGTAASGPDGGYRIPQSSRP